MLLVTTFALPVLFIIVIAGAGLLPARRRGPVRLTAAVLAPAAVLPALALAVTGAGSTLEIPWMLYGATFRVDGVGRALLLIAALLYGAALMAVSWHRLRDSGRGTGALSSFLLAGYVGNIGTYLAADVASFYLFFAVMSFSAAGLVIHHRTDAARRATAVYLVMSVLSETAILAGLILVAGSGGMMLADAPQAVAHSGNAGLIMALLVFGFGIKAGLVPLHVWLPLAHPAAPPAASAVLSGAMVKAGLVGWLRFLPLGEDVAGGAGSAGTVDTASTMGWALMSLSLLGAFFAVIVGVLQKDPKVVLAYSTISQMGFIGAVVAVGLIRPGMAGETAAAAVLYAVHHGLAKGALFLGVPVVKHYGRGTAGVLVFLGMAGAGLAVAGAPLTSGGFGKYVSKEAVSGITVAGVGLDYILPLVATGSTLLLMRFAHVVWTDEREPRGRPDGELFSWLLVCAAGITVPWLVGAYWSPLGLPDWTVDVVWNAVWPILLGLAVGALVWFLTARDLLPRGSPKADGRSVAPGDLVVAEEGLVRLAMDRGGQALDAVHRSTRSVARAWSAACGRSAGRLRQLFSILDSRLGAWQDSGLAALVVLGSAAGLIVVLAGGWLW
ncbi:hypothetical protein F7P69_20350 [Cellulosimicrobium funkei]|nr:hypothetical protein [Cellulosimicrobium funkei]